MAIIFYVDERGLRKAARLNFNSQKIQQRPKNKTKWLGFLFVCF